MQYFISFLEGIITFVSPCLLPMLPIYISYFAAGQNDKKHGALKNSLGFVLGFTIVFVTMGAFAGTIGALLARYTHTVNIISGIVVIVFGLNFLGVLNIRFLNSTHSSAKAVKEQGFFSTMLFGIVFSLGWTPCVGAFLGSALLLASQQGSVFTGIMMLLCYSAGLGIPFVISAIILNKLTTAFAWIKAHYNIINAISGSLLVLLGVLMMTGLMGKLLSMLTF
ncbi:MAG: cytochrome c biogenesis CcdA family protein [Oscillospiraceae bacterium]